MSEQKPPTPEQIYEMTGALGILIEALRLGFAAPLVERAISGADVLNARTPVISDIARAGLLTQAGAVMLRDLLNGRRFWTWELITVNGTPKFMMTIKCGPPRRCGVAHGHSETEATLNAVYRVWEKGYFDNV